jgi:FixJ family two-component response regulator
MKDGVRILIAVVDDEPSVRSSLARLLRSAEYEAATYPSGEDFLQSLDRESPDCLILDLRMPGLSGFDVLARLAISGRHVPVIVLTSFPSAEVRRRALREGVTAFLEKPVERRTLFDAIDMAIAS